MHQWHVEYPTLRNIGTALALAAWNASSPHGYQSTWCQQRAVSRNRIATGKKKFPPLFGVMLTLQRIDSRLVLYMYRCRCLPNTPIRHYSRMGVPGCGRAESNMAMFLEPVDSCAWAAWEGWSKLRLQ